MKQDNLFVEDLSLNKVHEQMRVIGNEYTVKQQNLALLAEKKKTVFIVLISVLILFVAINAIYFAFNPKAILIPLISVFLINFVSLIFLFYVRRYKRAQQK